jgi:hypothetical protein
VTSAFDDRVRLTLGAAHPFLKDLLAASSDRISVHQQNRVGISRTFINIMDSQTAAFSIGNFGVFRLKRKTLCIAYEGGEIESSRE